MNIILQIKMNLIKKNFEPDNLIGTFNCLSSFVLEIILLLIISDEYNRTLMEITLNNHSTFIVDNIDYKVK